MKARKELIEWLLAIIICMLLFLIIREKFAIAEISGSSMFPTYADGDYVIGYRTNENIKRNDVVAFEFSTGEMASEYHIKRVIGLPGDKIEITENELFVNRQKVTDVLEGTITKTIELKKDEFFMLGDNYEVSNDSRQHGPVLKEDIKVKIVLWSKDNKGDFLASE